MKENILVMTYNLNFIIKRMEQLIYDTVDYEVNRKLKIINEKIYEISDAIECIEIIIEDNQLDTNGLITEGTNAN